MKSKLFIIKIHLSKIIALYDIILDNIVVDNTKLGEWNVYILAQKTAICYKNDKIILDFVLQPSIDNFEAQINKLFILK